MVPTAMNIGPTSVRKHRTDQPTTMHVHKKKQNTTNKPSVDTNTYQNTLAPNPKPSPIDLGDFMPLGLTPNENDCDQCEKKDCDREQHFHKYAKLQRPKDPNKPKSPPLEGRARRVAEKKYDMVKCKILRCSDCLYDRFHITRTHSTTPTSREPKRSDKQILAARVEEDAQIERDHKHQTQAPTYVEVTGSNTELKRDQIRQTRPPLLTAVLVSSPVVVAATSPPVASPPQASDTKATDPLPPLPTEDVEWDFQPPPFFDGDDFIFEQTGATEAQDVCGNTVSRVLGEWSYYVPPVEIPQAPRPFHNLNKIQIFSFPRRRKLIPGAPIYPDRKSVV